MSDVQKYVILITVIMNGHPPSISDLVTDDIGGFVKKSFKSQNLIKFQIEFDWYLKLIIKKTSMNIQTTDSFYHRNVVFRMYLLIFEVFKVL